MSLLHVKEITLAYGKAGLFGLPRRLIPVLSNVSLTIDEGVCLGLLGSSGAGKSTLGKVILGLEKPSHGQIIFQGQDLYNMSASDRKQARRDLQVVFQDCYSSVNPRMTVEQIIGEPLDNYEIRSPSKQKHVIGELLEMVGLKAEDMAKYPNQFSGGQLQRINIARAIALKPKLIVLDESVSSLDMVTQTQILALLNDLKRSFGLSYLFITHNLEAAYFLSDRLAVLDHGELVEMFEEKEQILTSPHPAVQSLLQSVLADHPGNRKVRNVQQFT
ncbi:nickel import ATP-binding protein NikE [Paenibacillus sp. FSL H7-0331]|uniref:nickel import ATP-binding protein NikE n=1 Tax=Paenibacillus sp. FSL H7-0331 TaxID=1920421 RepID=UPI00096E7591|nr:nickel import ATP-binding protein NikE [Paenibacillus sp. FSL H7-0331]OMF18925.1 nickel import ATP-binding protein NikE [Paenibacillus sp. FSL H7-0331]